MPVACPVCETQNRDGAVECATCGHAFRAAAAAAVGDVARLDGLEETVRDQEESAAGPVRTIPELESTQVARRDIKAEAQFVPGVEHTRIEVDPNATSLWGGGVELDLGRELDDGVRTPAPEDTGVCPWCSAPSQGAALCDNCGRRRSRYLQPPAAAAAPAARAREEDNVMCPACFARVRPGPRCVECGVPFPFTELV
jgi:hypothetical protein